MAIAQGYEFGPYRLDVPKLRLLRDGKPVALTGKTFDVLVALIERRDRVVDKAELMQLLWPDSYVEEANLTQHIFMLRKTLGEDASGAQYIETVPRRGYRFAAEAREVLAEAREAAVAASVATEGRSPASEEAIGVTRRWALLAAGIALIAAGALYVRMRPAAETPTKAVSVAVLPFRLLDLSSNEDHVGIGMSDALITRLGRLGRVVVHPTGSVLRYVGVADPLAAGRELGTEYLVDGRIQQADGRIRVTVQLLRVESGTSVWADTFDEPYTDVFGVQDAIAGRVAQALLPNLSTDERARITRRETGSTEAYRWFVRGRYHWNRRTTDDLHRSVEFFKQAITHDPEYALAYAGLADAYNILGNFSTVRPDEVYPQAIDAAQRAIALDPELVEAHVSLVFARFLYHRDWAAAESGFPRAIAMNPNYAPAHQWYGIYLISAGRTDEALRELRRASELDPLSLVIHSVLGWGLYSARQYDSAIAQSEATLSMDAGFGFAYYALGLSQLQKGRFDAAIEALRKAAETGLSRIRIDLAHAYAVAGRTDEARQQLERATAAGYVSSHDLALVELALGNRERALSLLERSFDERHPWMVRLLAEPRWDPLHGEPRFESLVRRVGIPARR